MFLPWTIASVTKNIAESGYPEPPGDRQKWFKILKILESKDEITEIHWHKSTPWKADSFRNNGKFEILRFKIADDTQLYVRGTDIKWPIISFIFYIFFSFMFYIFCTLFFRWVQFAKWMITASSTRTNLLMQQHYRIIHCKTFSPYYNKHWVFVKTIYLLKHSWLISLYINWKHSWWNWIKLVLHSIRATLSCSKFKYLYIKIFLKLAGRHRVTHQLKWCTKAVKEARQ